MARVYKLGEEGLAGEGKPEKMLNDMGVAVRDSSGNFRDFSKILSDLNAQWVNMSNTQKIATSQVVGGINRYNDFMSLMNNYKMSVDSTTTALNAQGSATRENAIHMQTAEAKLGTLKATTEELAYKMINSDTVKYVIDEFTQLVTALSNVDGKTITYIATIGSLILVMTKLSKINKELMMLSASGGIVSGLTKFIGLASGMVALENGATGVATAFGVLGTSIKGATASAVAFMMTPLGLVLGALAGVLGIVVYGMVSYQQHQADLTAQSKSLKTALEGVNEALKGGDTSKAQEEADKMKKAQEKLQQYIELRKKAQEADSKSFNPTAGGADQSSIIDSFNKKIEEQIKVLKDAGYTVDETSGKVEEFAEAQNKIDNSKVINGIKEQTKAQLESRENLEGAKAEFDSYISTVQNLYSEYQNLSAQENLSAEQKIQLGSVVEQLQGKMSGLNVSIDENGNAYISNTPLIEANIQRLSTEGMTVDNLSAIRITDAKVNSEWQIGNSQVTYAEITNRIGMYKAEIQAIQQVMQARIAGSADIGTMSIAKAQSMEENSPELKDYKEKADQLRAYEKAKTDIDKLYAGVGSVPYSGGSGASVPSSENYSPSGGKDKSASDAKKAEQEAIKAEKKMIDDITDAYNKAKDIIENDIEEINYNIEMLGDADNSNFTERIDFTTDKLAKQREEVNKATNQLMDLSSVTATTSEAQESLENATLKASKELRTQKLEVAKLTQELIKMNEEQIKATLEKEKSIAELTLEANQEKQTKDLEDYTNAFEETHTTKMDAYDDELTALDKQNDAKEKANTLTEKELNLSQAEFDLERAKNSTSNYNYQKKADGSWGYKWTSDKSIIEEKQKTYNDAKKDLAETKASQELEEAKAVIEAKKKAEDDLYDQQKKLLEKHSEDLKSQQDLEKQRLDNYYSDIEKLAKDRLATLEQQYSDNWDKIAEVISTKLIESQDKFTKLTDIKVNFGLSGLQDAISSGDLNSYIAKNKDSMNKDVTLDLSKITNELNSIKTSQSDIKNNTVKTEDIISYSSESKNQISKIVEADIQSLEKQVSTLQEVNKQIEDEYDSHYKKLFEKQNKAQTDQYISLKNFADVYTKFTDQFLELVQIVYDYRFTNIVSIGKSSTDLIMQSLIVCEEAFEKIVDIWNQTHKEEDWIKNIDIKSVVADMNQFKESVIGYTSSKSSLYDDNNNPLYNSDLRSNYVDTSKYASQSAYALGTSNLLTSANAVTNNNTSSAKTVYQTSVNGVTVNADNAKEFLNSIVNIVGNLTDLS